MMRPVSSPVIPRPSRASWSGFAVRLEANRHDIIKYNAFDVDDAEAVILAFGSPVRTARHVQRRRRARGKKVGLFQILTAWPFPTEALQEIYAKTQASFVIPGDDPGSIGR